MSALILASQSRRVAVVELLLKSGANVNITCNYECSALHRAIGSPDVVKILLEWNIDTKQVNSHGQTALEEAVDLFEFWSKVNDDCANAAANDYQDCVDLLKQHEAKFQK